MFNGILAKRRFNYSVKYTTWVCHVALRNGNSYIIIIQTNLEKLPTLSNTSHRKLQVMTKAFFTETRKTKTRVQLNARFTVISRLIFCGIRLTLQSGFYCRHLVQGKSWHFVMISLLPHQWRYRYKHLYKCNKCNLAYAANVTSDFFLSLL